MLLQSSNNFISRIRYELYKYWRWWLPPKYLYR